MRPGLTHRVTKALYYISIIVIVLCVIRLYRGATGPIADTIHPRYGGCRITAKGRSGTLLLKGTVLTSQGALDDTSVLISSGTIAAVGSKLDATGATVLDCAGSVISPGFINTHEHISYSTVAPFQDFGEKVRHRHDWRVGARNNTLREPLVNVNTEDAITWGELRHIFSGTTSIVGGAMVAGLARNLDFALGMEADLGLPPDVYDVFPLDDPLGILRDADCDYGAGAIDLDRASKYKKYLIHVGEGLGEEAANEFRCLSNSAYDVLPLPGGGGLSTDIIAPNVALIHALGLTQSDFDLVAKRGAHVVWSPRSNVFLYGKTLDVNYLLDAGINVALGTDWLPSGSATMSREAYCALTATQKVFGYTLGSKTVWEMMTINAAKAAGFEEHLGSIEVGKLADIVVFRGRGTGDAFAQAAYAAEEDIELVLRGGKVLVAKPDLDALFTDACEAVQFGHVEKMICVAGELGSSFAHFEKSLGGVYSAILPGVPPDEPSCEPS
ncbi:hypothetical protein JX265_004535 [Neoarthrinium moseri]|uniref:Amidohydrolase-related domain-containing protein n=1 Tax=Neoarthrinium moseri TaxID=1658444 RepID=A0A9P9WR27_9PEZI|nr:uncharacterized protein JN550_008145 [Neoarthrinium moseri]KAI1851003.1 hypothetical protein JX266_003668 [Neoarthrinium moseri]KAI1865887.1 hypothetical protein JN550_008145 [Neoarthrinium moseri]KAI1875477.1 hypothetical protein JX265_004535 [Neoarthrinium moseri]